MLGTAGVRSGHGAGTEPDKAAGAAARAWSCSKTEAGGPGGLRTAGRGDRSRHRPSLLAGEVPGVRDSFRKHCSVSARAHGGAPRAAGGRARARAVVARTAARRLHSGGVELLPSDFGAAPAAGRRVFVTALNK